MGCLKFLLCLLMALLRPRKMRAAAVGRMQLSFSQLPYLPPPRDWLSALTLRAFSAVLGGRAAHSWPRKTVFSGCALARVGL